MSTAAKKRPRGSSQSCSFCRKPAAVLATRTKCGEEPLCLLHYFSTSAVRRPENVTIIDANQLQSFQDTFGTAFTQLQKRLEVVDATLASSERRRNDPLSILDDMAAYKPRSIHGQGFMRSIPMPQRLVETQKQQAAEQARLMKRIAKPDLSARRKASKQTIWHSVLDDKKQKAPATTAAPLEQDSVPCPVCQSSSTTLLSSRSGRTDVRKGETWGYKNDDVVVSRYQCNDCGRTWNHEE